MDKGKTWHKSKYPGVRYRVHPTRKNGIQPDKYFCIFYKLDGKTKSEAIGWESEKWTAEKAHNELGKLRENQRKGEGPRTMAEKREIEQQRREIEEQHQEKQDREAITFKKYFDDSYLPAAKAHKKASSITAEENYFDNWIKPVIGEKSFKDIAPLHIEKIKQNLIKAKRKPRTIEYVFAIVRQIWNMARRDGLTDRESPTKEVKKPKISNERQRHLSRAEADLLLDMIKGRSFQTYQFCLLSLHCGLRAGEIFNLRFQAVNMEAGTILISDGKGDKSRYVYMTKQIREMFSGMEWGGPDELVFKDRKGQKIQRISNVFQRSVKDLKFNEGVVDDRQKVVFHTLRHTFASWLAENGIDLYTIQKLMGHASFEMVQRYSHLGQNTLQAAARRLDDVLEQQQDNKVVSINR